jgi:hypothetical protein
MFGGLRERANPCSVGKGELMPMEAAELAKLLESYLRTITFTCIYLADAIHPGH